MQYVGKELPVRKVMGQYQNLQWTKYRDIDRYVRRCKSVRRRPS